MLLWQEALPLKPQAVLIGISGLCTAWLLYRGKFPWQGLWKGADRSAESGALRRIGRRLGIVAAGILGLVLAAYPAHLFDLPEDRPLVWLMVLLTYPLSVYPQELVYRAYFFARYQAIFPRRRLMIVASASLFSWVHLIYGNRIAVVLAFIGGLFFAGTYARTRSLRLVFLEHTLYGSLAFTLGLGEFFLLDGSTAR